jgi:hypothetical protein
MSVPLCSGKFFLRENTISVSQRLEVSKDVTKKGAVSLHCALIHIVAFSPVIATQHFSLNRFQRFPRDGDDKTVENG